MKKPYNVSDDKINTLFNILFQQAQDKNFKVFDNQTDKEILSVLQNGNVGFNNVNGNIFLCINIDGVLYKRSISQEVEPIEPRAYITQTYRNGTDWYRVYSDGWKEQGGTATANTTRNFPTPFTTTDYTIVATLINTGIDEAVDIRTHSKTDFKIGNDYNASCYWYACGY